MATYIRGRVKGKMNIGKGRWPSVGTNSPTVGTPDCFTLVWVKPAISILVFRVSFSRLPTLVQLEIQGVHRVFP